MVLLTRKFTETFAGPWPKLTGMGLYDCPAVGIKKHDATVVESAGHPAEPTARPGRALKMDVPRISSGMVMLYGWPELAKTNGLRRSPNGATNVPPMKTRLRTSNAARP